MAKADKVSEPKKEKSKYGKYDEWEIRDAADTLIRAEQIKGDAEKMKQVKKCLDEKEKDTEKAITSIQGIKDKYKEKYGDT